MTIKALLVLVAMCWMAGSAAQGLYKWVDDNGVTHFATQPPVDHPQAVESYELPRTTNVVAADSHNQFAGLAALSAQTLCQGRAAARESCIAEQISAARAVGEIADGTLDSSRRFHIQMCQQRHLLASNRPADFVALRRCVGGS